MHPSMSPALGRAGCRCAVGTPMRCKHNVSNGSLIMQEGVVQSAKEAFEAMSGSGGWSVYTNKAARRISDGGHSAGHTHEGSL